MTTDTAARRAPAPVTGRRWTALAVVALAQLMVALDATVVSIALPSAQRTGRPAPAGGSTR